ncbi:MULTISPECIES: hypothetical protein [Candidatus Williamhamiltonella]|uniref:Uncharacterized protein n=1 Tax=Hamiltonella defensa subsp. Acyrthosiphon pisum (strain 5AT) TaxID=572265 RepID=C4K6M4_HAMD5|nr:hypothetical protein [Candidatus Hamiltonella defensa]ACQ68217.1 hypothetical protein HDEF_1605 [Candidatus Hamiltonella defensa 5AT (Acyrthosiphon pisum)]
MSQGYVVGKTAFIKINHLFFNCTAFRAYDKSKVPDRGGIFALMAFSESLH